MGINRNRADGELLAELEVSRKRAAKLESEVRDLKKQNQALARQNAFRDFILDEADALIYLSDPKTYEILYANEKVKRFTGQDAVGRKCWEVFKDQNKGPCGDCPRNSRPDRRGRFPGACTKKTDAARTDHWFFARDKMTKTPDGNPVCIGIAAEVSDWKKTEDLLRESELKYRALFETANDGIMIFKDGRIVDVNQKALRIYGCGKKQMIGATPMTFTPERQESGEDSQALLKEKFDAALAGKPQKFEWLHHRLDGTAFYAEVSLTGLDIAEGPAVLGIVRDISKRKRLERNFADQAALNAGMADLAIKIIEAESIAEITELALEEAQNLTGSEVGFVGYIDPQTGYLVAPTMTREVWDACKVADKDFVLKKFAGLWGWVLENRKPLLSNDAPNDPRTGGVPEGHIAIRRFLSVPAIHGGKVVGQISLANADRNYTAQDLLAAERLAAILALGISRKQAEQALRVSETKLEGIVNSITDHMSMMDKDHNIVWANPVAKKLFGENVIGTKCYAAYHGRKSVCPECVVSKTFADGQTYEHETTVITQSGEAVDFWCTANVAEWNEDGTPKLVMEVSRDITERKRAERDLREALIESQRRAAEIAHLLEGAKAVQEFADFEKAAEKIFHSCSRAIGATAGYVALLSADGSENEIQFLESGGRRCDVDPNLPMPIRGLRAEAYRHSRVIYDNDFPNSQWMGFMPDKHVRLDNVMFAPMMIEGRAVGLLGLGNKPNGFSQEDARLASAFAEFASVALYNAKNLRALEQSEERIRLITDSLPALISQIDKNQRYLFLNKRYQYLFGLKIEDCIGKHIREVLGDRTYENIRENIRKALAGAKVFYEYDLHLPHGEVLHMFAHYLPQLNERGEVESVYIWAQDVSGLKMAEEALRQSEIRYRELFDRMSNGVAVYEAVNGGDDFVFKDINEAGAAIGRLNKEDHLGKRVTEVYPGIKELGLFEVIQQVLKTGRPRFHPASLYKDDRISLWINNYVYKLPTGEIVAVYEDVTERKQTEEELARLAIAIEQTEECVLVTDKNARILYVNPAYEKMSGYARDELMGRVPHVLQEGMHDREFLEDLWETIGSGNIWRGRYVELGRAGKSSDVEASISPIRDESGDIVNFAIVMRDIGEQLKVERQLRRSQKMEALGTLAGGIAHDFNNILSSVMGYTELALDDVPRQTVTYKNLQQVLRATLRARELIRQILAFSRQTELERRPLNVYVVVKEVVKLIRAGLPPTIEIRQSCTGKNCNVACNPSQIHQIIMNLCTNASHAMRDTGGVLSVNLDEVIMDPTCGKQFEDLPPGPYLRLKISDTGVGMDEKQLERIFDPFYTTKPLGEGTGLGLSVVHGIVETLGGKITVYSEPGQGTTFTVFLPLVSDNPLTDEGVSLCDFTGRERIMLVDDEEAVLDADKQLLERLGYRVTAENDPVRALQLFEEDPAGYDLVVTDQIMPGLTGIKLAEKMLKTRPDLPIVLCSGHGEVTTPESAQKHGIKKFLLKPLVKSEIAKAVRELLDRGDKET